MENQSLFLSEIVIVFWLSSVERWQKRLRGSNSPQKSTLALLENLAWGVGESFTSLSPGWAALRIVRMQSHFPSAMTGAADSAHLGRVTRDFLPDVSSEETCWPPDGCGRQVFRHLIAYKRYPVHTNVDCSCIIQEPSVLLVHCYIGLNFHPGTSSPQSLGNVFVALSIDLSL